MLSEHSIAQKLNLKTENVQIFKNVFDLFEALHRYLFSINGKIEDCKQEILWKVLYFGELHVPTGKYFCMPSNRVHSGPDNKPIWNHKERMNLFLSKMTELKKELQGNQ